MFSWHFVALIFFTSYTLALPIPTSRNLQRKSYEIPVRRMGLEKRGGLAGSAGLGDVADLLYYVSVGVGKSTTQLILDSGSSDMWVMSDKCTTDACTETTSTPYDSQGGKDAETTVDLRYGDSKTGTHASGPVMLDTVSVAGLSMDDQPFAAINDTDNGAVNNGASGIFGLGFPSQSYVQAAMVNKKFDTPSTTDAFITDAAMDGPLVARMAMSGQLEQPLFAISFQRNTIDIGGSEGALTIGRLPAGVDNSSLTWVPVRLYESEDGGQNAPDFAPEEVYPLRWEIPLDAVFLDGQKLPDTNLTGKDVGQKSLSALVDSGNSLLRGPQDVVDSVLKTISQQFAADSKSQPVFPCAESHTLAFQIGGKVFSIDPRDMVTPDQGGDATQCEVKNLVSTDAPSPGALFSWSLGAPFFRSNLVVFYFGNLTHPSVDPPRMGFLNFVPQDASDLLQKAVQKAEAAGGTFPSTIESAAVPTATIPVPATKIALPSSTPIASGNVRAAAAKPPRVIPPPASSDSHDDSAGSSVVFGGFWSSALMTSLFASLYIVFC
ncbi:acid protease [Cristinia sonorae]|uniref:Acid protease n=1 Tax=Cristinia sonorae TaxID=1940300 RepID=A0A8K0UI12_9AGAR|nr:acid protease [Cristinia sonorae]